jgi:sugar lactone lactonase YvrE
MTTISRVGDFTLGWGESLVWDDARGRLYFVDCATQALHWLEGETPPLRSLSMPSLPVGLVLADDGRLVVALDDGLHVVDADAGSVTPLSRYPEELGGRANDAGADLDGNLVTGTLNLSPAPGSYWWFSARDGWRQLDDGIGNANGPVVMDFDGETTLVFADTHASAIYAYPYDGSNGSVGKRRVFAETTALAGLPDGACADDAGGVWSCLFAAGKIARYVSGLADPVIDAGADLVTDVTFGGEGLDRLYYISISKMGGYESAAPNAGALMAVDDTGFRGRPEPRFKL